MGWGKSKSKKGAKFNNRTVVTEDGIEVDSKLEYRMLEKLKELGIEHKFQHQVILQPTIRKDNGDTVRLISLTVDFFFENYNGVDLYVDTKGYASDAALLRWKMLEKKLFDEKKGPYMTIWLRNDGHVSKFLSIMRKGEKMREIGYKDYNRK